MMRSRDVPQANSLETVRLLVRAIELGVDRIESLADYTGYSTRHAGYRLHAARILGFVRMDGDEACVTPLGERLLAAEAKSETERAVFYDAIQSSAVIQLLVPDLLSLVPPNADLIATRLFHETKLGRTTSLRRAGGLLAWRRYVFGDTEVTERKPRARRSSSASVTDGEQLSLF